MASFFGSLAGAAGNLIGGLLGKDSAEDQQAANIKMQKQFAQKGIQWKVADAAKAGVHPLYALGASTHSFSPTSVGDPLAGAVSDMGQNIGRAIDSGLNSSDRLYRQTVEALTLKRMGLENDLLATKIAAGRQPVIPGSPLGARYVAGLEGQGSATVLSDPSGSLVTPVNIAGSTVIPHTGWSDVEHAQKRYGEPAEWVLAGPTGAADFLNSVRMRARGGMKGFVTRSGKADALRWLYDLITDFDMSERR